MKHGGLALFNHQDRDSANEQLNGLMDMHGNGL